MRCLVAVMLGWAGAWAHVSGSAMDARGFLRESYPVHEMPLSMRVRQVPGDGNCLFYALSVALRHAETGEHGGHSVPELRNLSSTLRQLAVDVLTGSRNVTVSLVRLEGVLRGGALEPDAPRKRLRPPAGFCIGGRRLYLEQGQRVLPTQLLQSVADQYETSSDVYCQRMRREGTWGGGPEIVALSNILRRPIHVYELLSADSRFLLRLIARFGSPKFDDTDALHILSADSRFPSIRPGDQNLVGNHFLALFPCPEDTNADDHLVTPSTVLDQFKPDSGATRTVETEPDQSVSAPTLRADVAPVASGGAAGKRLNGGWVGSPSLAGGWARARSFIARS